MRLTSFDEQLRLLNEAEWNEWIKQEDIGPVVFILSERREAAKEKLPPSRRRLLESWLLMATMAGEICITRSFRERASRL